MVKRRVIGFFVLLAIFVLVLIVIRLISFGSLMGFVVSNPGILTYETQVSLPSLDNDFVYSVRDYTFVGSKLRVYYSLEDFGGRDQVMSIHYKLLNGNNLLREGSQEVVLPAKSRRDYSLEFAFPEDYVGSPYLQLNFSNGVVSKSAKIKDVLSSKSSLTGWAILERGKIAFSLVALTALIVFVFLLWSSRFYHKKHEIKKLRKNFDSKYIKLNINK